MKSRRIFLGLSLTLAGIYLAYVLWAKFAWALGPLPRRLTDTQEFLLFLAAIAAFTIEVFLEDARARHRTGDDA